MFTLRRLLTWSFVLLLTAQLSAREDAPTILVSVPDQKMVLVQNGLRLAQFPVSTSKFGLGDRLQSYATPLGTMEVAAKFGEGARSGAVFKHRRLTGEVLKPNAPGRDPIVTRILHLRGTQAQNARAYSRGIYIHGTPEERKIGRPASYGCIRMRSKDVARLYDAIPLGTRIEVLNLSINRMFREYAAN
jgi:lipoprotein-anchoring transpeptidase ErfK/SrfK